MRSTSGVLESRKLVNGFYTEDIPNAPAGKYVVLPYQAKFNSGLYSEQVVCIQEKDGSWRTIGYVMSPPQ
jgi:hypothetical protein